MNWKPSDIGRTTVTTDITWAAAELNRPFADYETVWESQDVIGFPGYMVSPGGVVHGRRGPLKPSISRGYERVRLYRQGVAADRYVHILVLEAFRGPPPDKRYQGCHGDGDRRNNHINNLSWRTRHENAADRIRHGTQRSANGEAHPNAKLTAEAVERIRCQRKQGRSYVELKQMVSDLYEIEVSSDRIGEICRGKAWRHLDEEKPMTVIALKVARIDESVPLPEYKSKGAAGLDLCSAEDTSVPPGHSTKVRTGIKIELPAGHFGLITPRSGLAVKHGITVLNTPGTIDEDYRGELHVILHNTGAFRFTIDAGMRIAQLIILPRLQVELFIVDKNELSKTERGEGGFGSTGV